MKKENQTHDRYIAEMKAGSKSCGGHCIRVKDMSVSYGNQKVLDQVNLHVHCGKLTAVIGRNGAGKSTLMKAILNEIPHEGGLSFQYNTHHHPCNSCGHEHKDILHACDMVTKEVDISQMKIGYVPQHLNIAKNTPTSVYDMFASYISNRPVFLMRSKKLYEKIKEQLKFFEAEDLIDKAVCDLSGGELQRVLLSMATMPVPNLLLLDEPVSGIDHNGMELFFRNIQNLKEHFDLAVILVSHDLEYVARYADHVVLLDHKIVKEGTAEEVFRSPEFKKIFGNMNYMEM
ncbi:zinc ABC transporter, ATP-binding protein ZnuC [Lachnospiraceae bacterium KM106-2]|nr:zinc ABC transporter, ATP-binding protein ZnuC [Lachnospiraceae bacterium KM106-2]